MKGTKNYGSLVPQCYIEKTKYEEMIDQFIKEFRRNNLVGYISVKWIAWKIDSDETKMRLSGIYPYLTENLLKAACLAVKCRLSFDQKSYDMVSKRELHWELPYLSRFVYADTVYIFLIRIEFKQIIRNKFPKIQNE
jgi:hypothetical protein